MSKFPWEKLKQEFVGWNEELQAIIDAADRDECYRWSLFFRPPVENGAASASPCWVMQFTPRFPIWRKAHVWQLRMVPCWREVS